MPPAPKPAHLRQRRNKEPTRATLPSAEESSRNRVPPLPKREAGTGGWHPMVTRWWKSVWTSPMASEYLEADMVGGLFLLARLHHECWSATGARDIAALSAEIRLQEVRFGLSPIDRRRLQWEVEKGEQAEERTVSRRKAKTPPEVPVADPRDVLRAVA